MELVIKSDWLYVMDSVLTPEECKEIIENGDPNMSKSETVGEEIKGYRTSSNTYVGNKSTPLMEKISLITEVLTEIPMKNQEDLCVVKYEEGEEYKPHHDYFTHQNHEEAREEESRGGDRVYTVMFYLNDDFEEGGTLFLEPNIEVRPKTGRCVIWKNYLDGKPNGKSFHAGLPIKTGVKYIGVKWIRKNEFK